MAYKPYKMKGHTLPGIKQRKSAKTADGRAGSSPFQDRVTNLTGMDKKQRAAATAHNSAHAAGEDPHGSAAKHKILADRGWGHKHPHEDIKDKTTKLDYDWMPDMVDPTENKRPKPEKKESPSNKKEKSPAKIAPLIAMAGKAIIGSAISKAMSKKEE